MAEQKQTLVFLLRGINVGGHKKVPMAELRALATQLGFDTPRTYIQSGNLIGTTASPPAVVVEALEASLVSHFGFPVDVVVRTATEWLEIAGGGPFPDAEAERPRQLHVGFAKRPALPQAERNLAGYLRGSERVAISGDVAWIDYAGGTARSKLTPKVLDRTLGAVVTCRNWRTVQKIADMIRDRA